MGRRYDTITFLSDYGLTDEFVGVVKSVIRSIAPEVVVIDLTHDIEPHDVRGGGLTLARSAQYLAPGVVLAVVDPGVGSDRRAVAIEVGDGQSVLIGPDNGLLAAAVAMVGGADRAVALTNPEYQLPAPGPTFAGRDVFAPAAAHLCNGVDLDALGEPVDPVTLLPGLLPVTREEHGAVVAEVLWIDRFGNAQLNVDPDEVSSLGDRVRLRFAETKRTAIRADNYAALRTGEVGLVVDSYGLLSIAVDRGSAAEQLGLHAGDPVTLESFEGPMLPLRAISEAEADT
jgi:S-adenosyl-L-methionine hydrolase (adenosine-forming)